MGLTMTTAGNLTLTAGTLTGNSQAITLAGNWLNNGGTFTAENGTVTMNAGAAGKNRYVVRNGALVAMPASPLAFVATRLFSWRAKLGLLGEPFRKRGAADREETVSAFVTRRLGREFLDYLLCGHYDAPQTAG